MQDTQDSVFHTHPVRMGLILSPLTLLAMLLSVFLPTFFSGQNGDIVLVRGITLGVIGWIVFVCTNVQAHATADTQKAGCRYAATVLLSDTVLIGALALFLAKGNLSALDPHSSMLSGLIYVIFFFYILIVYAAKIVAAVVTAVIYAMRARHNAPANNPISEE